MTTVHIYGMTQQAVRNKAKKAIVITNIRKISKLKGRGMNIYSVTYHKRKRR
jgi:hypothetical protein